MFLFWDLLNDEFEFFSDEGEFWAYGEDSVLIDRDNEDPKARYWMHICKIADVHPLNENDRFEVYDPRLEEWVKISQTHIETYREIFKLAGAQARE